MNKNCVLYLVDSNQADIIDFINSVKTIETYFLQNNPVDIICFHESPISPPPPRMMVTTSKCCFTFSIFFSCV